MIHSSAEDNWMRVEIMHSVAQSYYQYTHDSDFRSRMINGGAVFPFDAIKYEKMQKESSIVSMVMTWSVITIESLINHALADILNNKRSAIIAIEHPNQITDKFKGAKNLRSELSKKIYILLDGNENYNHILPLADELAELRNTIVHDKPFNFVDLGDGKVIVEDYRIRGERLEKTLMYEDLGNL